LEQCVHALTPPTATPSPSPSRTVPPAPPGTGYYQTRGRQLVDPEGTRVIVRGAEQVFWDASWLLPSFVTEFGRSGANAIRILPYYLTSTPTGEPGSTLAQIEDMIRRGINSYMLVEVAIDAGSDPSVYLRSEVRALLARYEGYLAIHAKGESYEDTDDQWVANSKSVVATMRGAGYKAPLYIMARTGGRNLPTLLNHGQEIVDADPLHNVVFGWQAYWGTDNHYQEEYGMPLGEGMRRAAAAPFPIQVGLTYHSDAQSGSSQTIPYSDLMRMAQELSLGWLWRDWRMGVDDLTADGLFGHWAHQGEDVVLTNANSIQRTSVRTPFQLNSAV
jgi:mannan endo-1,4-beta-mannosidase